MAVVINNQFQVQAKETGSGDLGTPLKVHQRTLNAQTESGTVDDQQDLVWSDQRSPAGNDDLDLRGGLTDAFGTTLNFIEVRQIDIFNNSTTADLTLGNGPNPAYSGLFGASTGTIVVSRGGEFHWRAPKDGHGLQTTAGTADILRVALSAGTYDILIAGVSA